MDFQGLVAFESFSRSWSESAGMVRGKRKVLGCDASHGLSDLAQWDAVQSPSSYTHAKQTDLVSMMRIALTGSRASHLNHTYGTHFFVIINKEKINNTHSGCCQKQEKKTHAVYYLNRGKLETACLEKNKKNKKNKSSCF